MKNIPHRFLDHKIAADTQILIIGTFNPDTEKNNAEFFYGRSRNFLWRLLPTAFGKADLKKASVDEKKAFISKYHIDFIDLIAKVSVEEGKEANYYDGYIDKKVSSWWDVVSAMKKLPDLKKVCFTRKSFADIPNMRKQVDEIRAYCQDKKIEFKELVTPARFYSDEKQNEWTDFLIND